jgi:Holliday junction resolvase-like predicted endonuclease
MFIWSTAGPVGGVAGFVKKTALRGHLRDKRFNTILQQGLGNVAESLARRLLMAEGFVVKDFSFNVSRYIAGVRYAGGMSAARRVALWEELLDEHGPLFADSRVKSFIDDLISHKKNAVDGRDSGGLIDLIAKRGNELLLVEVKSADSRLGRMQAGALELARKHGIKTSILRVRFSVKFDHGELYEVNSSRDVRVVNNLPHGTLG